MVWKYSSYKYIARPMAATKNKRINLPANVLKYTNPRKSAAA